VVGPCKSPLTHSSTWLMYVCGFSLFAGLASVVCIHGGWGKQGLIYNVGWFVFTAPVKGR
jgi:hypothetical protein